MVDFAKLAAEAKARREAAEGIQSAGPEVSQSTPNNTEAHENVGDSAPESPAIPRAAAPASAEAQRPANPFAKGKATGSGDQPQPVESGPQASGGTDSVSGNSVAGLKGVSLGAGAADSDSDTSGLDSLSLDSLDALDASESEGIAPRQGVSHFADETPATKPTRELPEGLDKEQLGFVDLIDGVYEVVHEADLMGGVIRNIIIELKEHPEYMKLVAPDDIRLWVRGMRESMGLQKIKKTEAKAKRSGGAGKKSKLVDEDMLADLADLGVSIPE